MKMYGNVINRVIEQMESNEPQVGGGVTLCYWSDRVPCTIINVKSKCRILVQRDKVRAGPEANGIGHQDWIIERDENGTVMELIKTKHGWKVLRESTRAVIGKRDYYYDWSF